MLVHNPTSQSPSTPLTASPSGQSGQHVTSCPSLPVLLSTSISGYGTVFFCQGLCHTHTRWRASCSHTIDGLSSSYCGWQAGQRCARPLKGSFSSGIPSHRSDGLIEYCPTVAHAVEEPRTCLCLFVPLLSKQFFDARCVPTVSLAICRTRGGK